MSLRRSYQLARARRDLTRRWRARSDPWQAAEHPLPHDLFGGASSHGELERFLHGECAVNARTVDELCAWLRDCEYIADHAHFGVADRWLHPDDFFTLRRGDCEDHALWAWRTLARLGHHAELVVGEWIPREHLEAGGAHAWVVYHDEGRRPWILECVEKRDGRMRRPLEEARAEYEPYYSVDTRLRTRMYAGYAKLALMGSTLERERRRRTKSADAPALETIDFGLDPTPAWLLALLMAICLIPFSVLVAAIAANLFRDGISAVDVALVAGAAALVLAFAALVAGFFRKESRLSFGEEGVRLRRRWLGDRLVRWGDVTRASLSAHKAAVTLRLYTRGGGISIGLTEYRRARSLYDAIEQRIPVGVEFGEIIGRRLTDR